MDLSKMSENQYQRLIKILKNLSFTASFQIFADGSATILRLDGKQFLGNYPAYTTYSNSIEEFVSACEEFYAPDKFFNVSVKGKSLDKVCDKLKSSGIEFKVN